MHRSKLEKLTDYVTGEAVAWLLKQNAPVSGASLANRLSAMAAKETNRDRQQALALALAEVRTELPSARAVAEPPRRSGSESVSAGAKKH
ncbi:hypothetical protein BBB56_16010 [Candidatus Pantoea deserta]|uniref:Uncharacterized protein n=1 Tax=Candidatus Pantoea deserta TaxID=1869313 RepID=A0A3N4P0I9_9GAMM|nr:hypothetical protein [Pantoea deserta]RPD98070.1 hypothetical protein BBB56_16010 [Pantoea deserta]